MGWGGPNVAHGSKSWSVPHRRVGISVTLGVIGVFIICGAAGMANWMVGAIGLAILAAAVGLYAVSALNSRAFSFIPGTAHVVSASEPPATATKGRCNLHILVTARNVPGVAVKIRDANVPVAKWPDAGSDLPILVAVGDPRRVRIRWDEVPAHGAIAKQGSAPDIESIPDADDENANASAGYGLDDENQPADADAYSTGDPEAFDGEPFDDEPGSGEPFDEAEPPDNSETREFEPVDAAVVTDADAFDPDDDDDDLDRSDDDGLVTVAVPTTRGGQVIELDVMDPSVVRWSPESTPLRSPTSPAAMAAAQAPRRRPSPRPSPRPRVAPDDSVVAVSFADPAPAIVKPDEIVDAVIVEPDAVVPAVLEEPDTVVDAFVVEPITVVSEPVVASVMADPVAADPVAADPQVEEPFVEESVVSKPAVSEPAVVPEPEADVEAPTVPLRFDQARVVTPAVTAEPDGDQPFDQVAAATTDAYLAATPPPGASRPGRIRSVAVTLFVTNLPRSILFYRDTLGFGETDAGHGSAVLESGDARIVLRRVEMPPVDRRLVQLLLEVPDVQAAYADLQSRGVTFIHRPRPVGQYQQMELWSAAFRDPDGHGIAVTQWRSLA